MFLPIWALVFVVIARHQMQGLRFPYVSTHLGFGFCRDSKTSDAGAEIPLCFYPFGLLVLS
jgi:hypothetical protein